MSLSSGSESIEPDQNERWFVVGDDSPVGSGEDFFTVRAEGYPFTGTLGGLAVDAFYLVWIDDAGSANDGFALPTSEDIFSEYDSALFQMYGYDGDFTSGTISNVSMVPLPTALWLFGSGLLGLIGISRRKESD